MGLLETLKGLLTSEEDKLQNLLAIVAKETDNAIIITDHNGKIIWVNDSFQKLSGYTLEELRGKVPGHVLQGPGTNPETVKRIREHL